MPRKKRTTKQPSRSAKRQNRNRESTTRASSAAVAAIGAPEGDSTEPTLRELPEYLATPLELGDGGDTIADLSEGIAGTSYVTGKATPVDGCNERIRI